MKQIMFYCDRCGRKIPSKDLRINVIRALDYQKSNDYETLNLCNSCMKYFWSFMSKKVLSYSDISKED